MGFGMSITTCTWALAETVAPQQYGFTRQEQDDYAVTSFQRALSAATAGTFQNEILPMEVKAGKESFVVQEDESLKRFNQEKLRKLRPAFGEKGTVTAGNASSINDGAAAVRGAVRGKSRAAGVRPQARIVGYAVGAREPEWFTLAPVLAVRATFAESRAGMLRDVDLFEINEAFSVVPMAAMRELGHPA